MAINLKTIRNFSLGAFLKHYMPTGLLQRSLLIIVVPAIITQIIIVSIFMERHWNSVTRRLSNAVVSEIAFIVDMRMRQAGDEDEVLSRIAGDVFNMSVAFLPGSTLPDTAETSIFALLHASLSREINDQIGRPFWVDTVTYRNYVDIRVLLPGEVMRVLAQRDRVYATNTHIFVLWLVGTSSLLMLISVLFLRNQIQPIRRLALAAQQFGKGRRVPEFKPSGAAEVRSAAASFMEMRDRLQAQIEQRTTMLAGVSHDLRTPLTRLKLQLAMMPKTAEINELKQDIGEMEYMLNDYLAFAQGHHGEKASRITFHEFISRIHHDAQRHWTDKEIELDNQVFNPVQAKPNALRRCLDNLINNACRHGSHVTLKITASDKMITITIDDDGPGIPRAKRDEVFQPFFRLEAARAQQERGGSGLGLAIARDIARGHGGDIAIKDAPIGGCRAQVTIPI